MDSREKTLLLQLILEDIRGNWGWENANRTEMARDLAVDLNLPETVDLIDAYEGDDGRHFRCSVVEGGYEGMEIYHRLESTWKDRTEEFKTQALKYLTYPENAFNDYKEVV